MNTERKIAEKMIADAEKMTKEGKQRLADLEATFSVGDRFRHGVEEVILVNVIGENTINVALIRLDSGKSWNYPFYAKDILAITEKEISKVLGYLVRNYDNRKKVSVNGK